MKHSLKDDHGYILIDHQASPGTKEIPEGKVFEGDLLCCSHCCVTIILNPAISNIVHYCSRCDAYVCEACKALGECFPMTELIEACGAGKLNEVLLKRTKVLKG